MFTVKFYETKTGESDVWNFLEELRLRSHSNKDARIQYNQLLFYIDLLSKNGTFLPSTITKHIDEDIWELRPGSNRVLYFYCDNDAFVLLHHFRKKTMKSHPVKFVAQKQNATIILPERKRIRNENLDRL